MKYIITLLFSVVFLAFPHFSFAEGLYTTEKLITVDIGSQTLTAWEGGQIQHQNKVSTGMYLTPTVKGDFRTYWKTPIQDMRGPSPYTDIYPSGHYLVKDVPNVMYFYQGYAIHGTYWHHSFGTPASHGCVNVPLEDAQWLYDWAPTGTRVVVF